MIWKTELLVFAFKFLPKSWFGIGDLLLQPTPGWQLIDKIWSYFSITLQFLFLNLIEVVEAINKELDRLETLRIISPTNSS